MNKLTVAMPFSLHSGFEKTLRLFLQSPLIDEVFILHEGAFKPPWPKCKVIRASSLSSGRVLNNLIERVRTDFLMMIVEPEEMEIPPGTLDRLIEVAETTDSGMIYSDYLVKERGDLVEHPVNDYQLGSIRDEFDFGYLIMFSVSAIRRALRKYGPVSDVVHAGLYDLRLKVSVDQSLFHIQEFLYTKKGSDTDADKDRSKHENHFNYVDPRNQAVQKNWKWLQQSI